MSAPLYERASASKALAFTSILCTMLVTYFDVPGENLLVASSKKAPLATFSSSPLKLAQNILLSQTAFRRIFPELILGVGVLYVFRHLERVFGSRKFVSFCLASSTLSIVLQVCLLVGFAGEATSPLLLTPGPFAPLFSLFVLYFWHVPALSFPLVNNIKYNSKLPVYFAGAFLATVDGKNSFIPACLSVLAGVLVYTQLKRLDMPNSVARFGTRFIEPVFRQSEPPAQRRRNNAPQYGAFPAAHDEDEVLLPNPFGGPVNAAANRGGPNQPPVVATPQPREEDILTLVQMGFDIDAATEALRKNRNDVNRAADALLFQS